MLRSVYFWKINEYAPMFTDCTFAQQLWLLILQRIGMPAVAAPAPADTSLVNWWERSQRRLCKKWCQELEIGDCTLWWMIWKERNARIFRQLPRPSLIHSPSCWPRLTCGWRLAVGGFLPWLDPVSQTKRSSLRTFSFFMLFPLFLVTLVFSPLFIRNEKQ